jgi:hypothetical protein
MSRSLSLISFSSRLFPAHWALWIPHSSSSGNTGTLLNARGDALNGFEVIFERDYNLADAPVHRIIPLGDMREEHVTDAKENDGRQAEGTVAMNHVEEVALGVSAPGRRLRKMGGVEVCLRIRKVLCG